MPIILPHNLTSEAIRVLQEFRRLNAETLPLATLVAIRHPADGGERPILELTEAGFLTADDTREHFTLTDRAREFLAIEAKPMDSETTDAGTQGAGSPSGAR